MSLAHHLTTICTPLDYHLTSTWLSLDYQLSVSKYHLIILKILIKLHPQLERIDPKLEHWHRFWIVRVSPLKIFGGGSRPMRSLDSELSTNHRPPFQANFILWLILKAATVLQFSQSKPDGNCLSLISSFDTLWRLRPYYVISSTLLTSTWHPLDIHSTSTQHPLEIHLKSTWILFTSTLYPLSTHSGGSAPIT